MRKPKHADIDRESARCLLKVSPKLLEAVLSAPSDEKTKQKTQKQKRQGSPPQSSVVDRVDEEVGQRVPPEMFRDLILEPHAKLAWTKDYFKEYEEARLSAENAMRKIFAATGAAKAGFESETPILDVLFFKVRVGLIHGESREIAAASQYARQIGKLNWFNKRLAAELHNATKRVPDAQQFNQFRAQLVMNWLRYGYWLMSDHLIASVLPKPFAGYSRQAITKAVKELELVKYPDTARALIVKGLGQGGVFVFRQGYPPAS